MSETRPSFDLTPNSERDEHPYDYVDGAPEVLQVRSIDNLRIAQETHKSNEQDRVDPNDLMGQLEARRAAVNDFDQMIKDYLANGGIEETQDEFNEYYTFLRDRSIDKIADAKWNREHSEDDGTVKPAGRTEAFAALTEKYLTPTTPDPEPGPTPDEIDEAYRMHDDFEAARRAEAEKPTDEQIDDAYEIHAERETLSGLRDELAAMTAKRQGKLFNIFNKKYNALKQRYNDQLIKVGKLEYDEFLANDEKTADEKTNQVVSYLINEQAQLREQTKENLKGTRVGKFVEFMNRGGIVVRVVKGVALGAVVAGTVATGGALLVGIGFAAGATATAGTAATLASRFARGFATRDAREGRGMADAASAIDANAMQTELRGSADHFAEGVARIDETFEADSKLENKKRRRSARFGAIAIAVGGLVGTVGAELVNGSGVGGVGKSIGHHWRPSWQEHDSRTGSSASPAPTEGNPDSPTTGKVHEKIPTMGGSGGESVPTGSTAEIGDAAHVIKMGEGWYQTFSEMGIANPHDQAALLNDDVLMGKLANMKLAYPDENIGGWGIRMTPDGRMPQPAIDLIRQHAAQHGYALVG